ncbi:dephospho-CoA kinase [Chiayiivirga flava]|uniref:Dephospho-CoA kinase n=1 Tax=Chiayiivirga flava TaxID=659595 RepID=A0A7W8D8X5_9GAMM|nr:dephospho-CoA kinase [Chiayiivirga flava]MBB5208965.1 dephospho-CoA kinase [Chiayiivirga flava]
MPPTLPPPLRIAVTGGIASGKTAVTQRFEALGVRVIDADIVSRELVEPGQAALTDIEARFGAHVLQADGRLDRRTLREIVFSDAQARRDLEAILHSRVRARLRADAEAATGPYVLLAIPLLAESTYPYDWLDRVLVVDVPREVQIARVMRRDGVTRAEAELSLAAQASRAARLALADDVIINDGAVDALDAIVARLHLHYLGLAAHAAAPAPAPAPRSLRS